MRLKVTLSAGDKRATVYGKPPNIHAGQWIIAERSRRAAFKRLGLDPDPLTNHSITSTATIRAVDADGWHTYTIWSV